MLIQKNVPGFFCTPSFVNCLGDRERFDCQRNLPRNCDQRWAVLQALSRLRWFPAKHAGAHQPAKVVCIGSHDESRIFSLDSQLRNHDGQLVHGVPGLAIINPIKVAFFGLDYSMIQISSETKCQESCNWITGSTTHTGTSCFPGGWLRVDVGVES